MKHLTLQFTITPAPDTMSELAELLITSARHMEALIKRDNLPTIMALRDQSNMLRGAVTFHEKEALP
jgi:hypothetical protein